MPRRQHHEVPPVRSKKNLRITEAKRKKVPKRKKPNGVSSKPPEKPKKIVSAIVSDFTNIPLIGCDSRGSVILFSDEVVQVGTWKRPAQGSKKGVFVLKKHSKTRILITCSGFKRGHPTPWHSVYISIVQSTS
jgi:hypothetical protein